LIFQEVDSSYFSTATILRC